MAWLCVNRFHSEWVFQSKPIRGISIWVEENDAECKGGVHLPKGSIKKIIGRELKWEDEAVEL